MAKMTKAQMKRRLQEAHDKCVRVWVSSSPTLSPAHQRRLLSVIQDIEHLVNNGLK